MEEQQSRFRLRLYEIIFESDTRAGKIFDISLLILIIASITTVCLESIPEIYNRHPRRFYIIEMIFTGIFTVEYILRLVAVKKPLNYVKSFYGVTDLMAIVPSFFIVVFPQLHFLVILRALRLLRLFRIFRLVGFLNESLYLVNALWSSRKKIFVFFFAVVLLTIVAGSVMYVIEHGINDDFHSIPQSIYWAIVTLTTVGYGDISPVTPLGKILASFIMLLGYCIIAVPTGIVSASIIKESMNTKITAQTCPNCLRQGHDDDAEYCKFCSSRLHEDKMSAEI